MTSQQHGYIVVFLILVHYLHDMLKSRGKGFTIIPVMLIGHQHYS